MPKLRTHRATAKRFKILKTGKVLRPHAQKSHLLSHKSQRRKRQYRKLLLVTKGAARQVRRALPYR